MDLEDQSNSDPDGSFVPAKSPARRPRKHSALSCSKRPYLYVADTAEIHSGHIRAHQPQVVTHFATCLQEHGKPPLIVCLAPIVAASLS